jgi:uncharacterized protein (DUF58 family)
LLQNPEKILQRLDWTVIRRLDGLLQGEYRTLFHGSGLDLADLREYQLTDDVRYIDWNVTARMQVPYVRQYMEDREMTAWFLLDLSPSVDFGTVNTLKRNLLIDFVAVLARLLTRRGNRIAAVFYSGKVERMIPARSGKNQVLSLINDLIRQPALESAPMTNLTDLFKYSIRTISRRSMVFVVSDFISAPGWEKALGMLNQRHEVLTVRLYDPREMELPDIGYAVFEDAETGEQLYVDTHDSSFRKRFDEDARRRVRELKGVFSRIGTDCLELSTEGDLVSEIFRFATLRKQRKMAPASFARASWYSLK